METICSQQEKVENDTKTFWFRFQNDIVMFVLSFLSLKVRMFPLLWLHTPLPLIIVTSSLPLSPSLFSFQVAGTACLCAS